MCVVQAISAIPLKKKPKNEHHKNQRPIGDLRFDFKCVVPKLQLFSAYTVPKVGHFVTSVSMRKGLHTFSICIWEAGGLKCKYSLLLNPSLWLGQLFAFMLYISEHAEKCFPFYESDGKCSCECINCCSKAFNGSLKYNTACFSSFLCDWASSSQFSIRWEAWFQRIYSSLTRRRFCTLVLFIIRTDFVIDAPFKSCGITCLPQRLLYQSRSHSFDSAGLHCI